MFDGVDGVGLNLKNVINLCPSYTMRFSAKFSTLNIICRLALTYGYKYISYDMNLMSH